MRKWIPLLAILLVAWFLYVLSATGVAMLIILAMFGRGNAGGWVMSTFLGVMASTPFLRV